MVSRGLTRRGLVKTWGERSPVRFWVQSYNIQEAESSFMCIKMCIAMCIKICITTHITMYITICITMYITHLLTPSFSALCAATPTCTASAGHIYSLSPPHAPYKPLIQHKTPNHPHRRPLFPPYAPPLSPLCPQSPPPLFSQFPLFPPYAVNTAAILSPPSPAHIPSTPAIPIPPVNMWITP